MKPFDKIYDTMLGHLLPEHQVIWVEDAFAPGSFCDREYEAMRQTYASLCRRLDAGEEDAELDAMIRSMERIQRELCERMFAAGMLYRTMSGPREN